MFDGQVDPEKIVVAVEEFDLCPYQRTKAVPECARGTDGRFEPVQKFGEGVVDASLQQILLVFEVKVDRSLGNACFGGNLLDAGRG